MSAPLRRASGLLLAALPLAGVLHYWSTDAHARHDPVHALQQLDLLHLDEPAPLADVLGLREGEVSVVVVCDGPDARPACAGPDLERARVVTTQDPDAAAAYALSGRTGYALVDRDRRVRYRTVDPAVAEHGREIAVLVEALR